MNVSYQEELEIRECEGDDNWELGESNLSEKKNIHGFNRKRWPYFILYLFLFLGSFLIGYTIIGKRSLEEVFQVNMWLHLYNLFFG